MRYYGVDTSYPENRAMGLSVRCFKDERAEGKVYNTLTLNVMSGGNLISTGVSFSNSEPLSS